MGKKPRRRKKVSPYDEYRVTLEETEKGLLEVAKQENSMLIAVVAPLFLPPGILEAPAPPEEVAISREESMGLAHIIEDVERNHGLPPGLILLIETIGGNGASAYSMARLLRTKFEKITVFVPHFALSAGTMIACIGDEIVMDVTSQLGPFDAQIEVKEYGTISASAVRKGIDITTDYYRRKGIKDARAAVEGRIDPVIQGLVEEAQRAGEVYLTEILTQAKYKKRVVKKIVRTLVWDFPTHEFPITAERAQEMGLRVALRSEYPDLWVVMEQWMERLAFHPSNEDHLVAYTYPTIGR
jgi:hypothetical protein